MKEASENIPDGKIRFRILFCTLEEEVGDDGWVGTPSNSHTKHKSAQCCNKPTDIEQVSKGLIALKRSLAAASKHFNDNGKKKKSGILKKETDSQTEPRRVPHSPAQASRNSSAVTE